MRSIPFAPSLKASPCGAPSSLLHMTVVPGATVISGGAKAKLAIETLAPDKLGVDVAPRLKVLKVEEPPKRKSGIKVKTVAELVDKLRNEAGVI